MFVSCPIRLSYGLTFVWQVHCSLELGLLFIFRLLSRLNKCVGRYVAKFRIENTEIQAKKKRKKKRKINNFLCNFRCLHCLTKTYHMYDMCKILNASSNSVNYAQPWLPFLLTSCSPSVPVGWFMLDNSGLLVSLEICKLILGFLARVWFCGVSFFSKVQNIAKRQFSYL